MKKREPYPSEKQDQYMLRLPDGMRDKLKLVAEKNKRSLNAEIVARLEWTLDNDVPEHVVIPRERFDTLLEIVERLERLVDQQPRGHQ